MRLSESPGDILPLELVLLAVQRLVWILLAVLAAQPNAVLVAPPGAGKTTSVPLALLNAAPMDQGRILMLEPRRLAARVLRVGIALLLVWLISAYLILPALWRHYEHHPALEDAPKTTLTAQGIPGDPLNVALLGTEEEVVKAMISSGWDAADPVTLR